MNHKLLNKVKRKSDKKKTHSTSTPIPTDEQAKIFDTVIITDRRGMRFTHYSSDSESFEVVITKDFYEPELCAMEKLVKNGSTVIDVGANIGLFSVFLSREIGEKGKLFAFEPIKETFWRMRENLALNKCANVIPFQAAVSNKQGKATMNVFPEGYGAWNTFGKPVFGKIAPVAVEKVDILSLDSFAKSQSIKKIDFLKIDVEGFERDVLEGARELMSNNRVKYLSFEISDIPLKGAGRTSSEIFSILHEYGYKAYEFDPKKKKFVGPILESDSFYQNYFASKLDMRKI
jgi:FkbM family methyltransferase